MSYPKFIQSLPSLDIPFQEDVVTTSAWSSAYSCRTEKGNELHRELPISADGVGVGM